MAKNKKIQNKLSAKHFSRYGEFLASFELSKHGWDVFNPLYDEYIDLLVHKVACVKCGRNWDTSPTLICDKCKKEITSTNKKNIKAEGVCKKCGYKFSTRRKRKCPKCDSKDYENKATCPFPKCNGTIEVHMHDCKCDSQEFKSKFRTIQVKSSNLEGPGTYAVDLRPKDLTQGENHYYIWVCVDNNTNKFNFLVIPIKDFRKEAKNFIESTSFLKDQGREHFSAKNFGKWKKYLDAFDKLE